ncbi:LPS translocon maturation chaperone LptM [Beggiatoa leptomitoformis]|uniref:Lipoprotein n=1 Tax=Beggiatoa leptomitoformis TaxID=288004 RepID=A0A650GRK1_9GAMM|nr:lipoprotein [Beggiatoa leptomitoformis]QGX03680.1 hypothetical protein AL038_18960 [Beggiatoa leptomitoformis]QGX04087.1 hypothetical protein BLE401_18630 [Beggiatoa leptomitoformis]
MKKTYGLCIVLLLCYLTACGQKGDLVRPVPDDVQALSKKSPVIPVHSKTNENK